MTPARLSSFDFKKNRHYGRDMDILFVNLPNGKVGKDLNQASSEANGAVKAC
jgi:hypothetical protein